MHLLSMTYLQVDLSTAGHTGVYVFVVIDIHERQSPESKLCRLKRAPGNQAQLRCSRLTPCNIITLRSKRQMAFRHLLILGTNAIGS